MERQENATVAPATLFMGLTVLVVAGAAVYYFTRPKDEPDAIAGGNGDDPNGDDPNGDDPNGGGLADGIIAPGEWNTSPSQTNVVALEKGRAYDTVVTIPGAYAGQPFSVNKSGNVQASVGGAVLSNIPNAGAAIAVRVVPESDGSLEFVWPEGAVVGQTILHQYRRLNFVVHDSPGGEAIA